MSPHARLALTAARIAVVTSTLTIAPRSSDADESTASNDGKQTTTKQTTTASEPTLRARLTYERATGADACPEERLVEDALRAQLGLGAIDPKAKGHIHLRVVARAGAAREVDGHIELSGEDGARAWAHDLRADHADCKTLIASLAISLRVAVSTFDRQVQTAAPEARRPFAVEVEPPPTVVRGTSLPPPPVSPARGGLAHFEELVNEPMPPAFRSWASAAAAIGAAPSVGLRLSIHMGLQWPGVYFAVEARGMPPTSGTFPGYRLEAARWEGAFLPCLTHRLFFACASVAAGGLWIQAIGPFAETRAALHVAAGGRVGGQVTVTSRLALLAYVDVEAPLLAIRHRMSSYATWEEWPVQVAVGLAVMGAFPAVQQ